MDDVSLLLGGGTEDEEESEDGGGVEDEGGSEDVEGAEDTGGVEEVGGVDSTGVVEDVRGVLEYEVTASVEELSLLPGVEVGVSVSELVVSAEEVSPSPGGGSLPFGGGLPKFGVSPGVVSGDELPEVDILLLLGDGVDMEDVIEEELSIGVVSLLTGGDDEGDDGGVSEDDGGVSEDD